MLQGSEEWANIRCGKATASEFSSILAKGQGKTRASYFRRVLAERLTGKPTETYRNSHMDRGTAEEPFARMAYEEHTGAIVEEIGFIQHKTLMAGCSPDGLVGDKGGVEIKSVIPTVQLETILAGGYPSEHKAQIQGNLWISERESWDFTSYCSLMPRHLQLYVFRVERDEKYIKTIEDEVTKFLNEVDEAFLQLMEKANGLRAA